jgi:predicted transcriptional regulator of viral defense system
MNYLAFRKQFLDYKVFSLMEIEKINPDFNRINLVNWQNKGYLIKLRNGWYRFAEVPSDESLLFLIANRIYSPSYVSFHSAAAWHGMIPEAVFTITSATTIKTANYTNQDGAFKYITIKSSLFFGYGWIRRNDMLIRMANIEKTLIDLMYMDHTIDSITDLEGMRLNKTVLKESIILTKLDNYLKLIDSPVITKRITLLKKYLYD